MHRRFYRSTPRQPTLKTDRHNAIRTLLGKAPVTSQDELRRKLARRGFHVTQATLSRDIHELKLLKGPAGYALPPIAADDDDEEGPSIENLLESFGLEVRQAQNLLVVIATTGGAQAIAAGIDYEEWGEVIGTIAGDDNVLVICADTRQAEAVRRRMEVAIG